MRIKDIFLTLCSIVAKCVLLIGCLIIGFVGFGLLAVVVLFLGAARIHPETGDKIIDWIFEKFKLGDK